MPYDVLFEADCGPVRYEGLAPQDAVRKARELRAAGHQVFLIDETNRRIALPILEGILRLERGEARSFAPGKSGPFKA